MARLRDRLKSGAVPDEGSPGSKIQGKETKVRPRAWTFSFRYWEQSKNYGCSECDAKWFVGLLEKLRDLCRIPIEDFQKDRGMQAQWRFHDVDWKNEHVTLSRSNCDWVETDYLNNSKDYPFVQFHLGKAFGRVMGFLDENQVFNVVLLDPMHNIHLSSYNGYKIRSCGPLETPYAALLAEVDAIHSCLRCETKDCGAKLTAAKISLTPLPNAVFVPLRDGDLELLENAIKEGRITSLGEVFIDGLAQKL